MSSGTQSGSTERASAIPAWDPQEFRRDHDGVKVLRHLKYPLGYTLFKPKIRAAIKGRTSRRLIPDDAALNYSFPKELAYVEDMESWNEISETKDYQQTEVEAELLKHNAKTIAEQIDHLRKGKKVVLIDLGPARSDKIMHVIKGLIENKIDKKDIKYVAVDLHEKTLKEQIGQIRSTYNHEIQAMGLLGTFEDADSYYEQIDGARVFCSFGSIFFNGPDDVVSRRCREMAGHLRMYDLLLVGQDAPHVIDKDEYDNETYKGFIYSCLEGVHRYAGIKSTNIRDCWSLKVQSMRDSNIWVATALQDLKCDDLEGMTIPKDRMFHMFKSWKRGVAYCGKMADDADLQCSNLWIPPQFVADEIGWREYTPTRKRL